MGRTKVIEGVTYFRYVLRFKCQGKTKRRVLWSPGAPWLHAECQRLLSESGADIEHRATLVWTP